MLIEVLTFLANNKAIIVGAAVTFSEVAVVLVNMYRRFHKSKDMQLMDAHKHTIMRNILWSANPINLFRKP